MSQQTVTANEVSVSLTYNHDDTTSSILCDTQRQTRQRSDFFITATPKEEINVALEFERPLIYRTRQEFLLVSIACDDGNEAQMNTGKRTTAWVLSPDTSDQKWWFGKEMFESGTDKAQILRHMKMPKSSAKPSFLPRRKVRDLLSGLVAARGGISVYVHRVPNVDYLKVAPGGRKHISQSRLAAYEGKQALIAEFHFLNKKPPRKAAVLAKQLIQSRVPKGMVDSQRDDTPQASQAARPSQDSTIKRRKNATKTSVTADPKLKSSLKSKLASDAATSTMPNLLLGGKEAKAKSFHFDAFNEKTGGKHVFFEDDDQDDEEPLPTRLNAEIKQERGIGMSRSTPFSTMGIKNETDAVLPDVASKEKAKKRARLSQQLEEIEIEEKELQIKKRKIALKRQLMELDEEN